MSRVIRDDRHQQAFVVFKATLAAHYLRHGYIVPAQQMLQALPDGIQAVLTEEQLQQDHPVSQGRHILVYNVMHQYLFDTPFGFPVLYESVRCDHPEWDQVVKSDRDNARNYPTDGYTGILPRADSPASAVGHLLSHVFWQVNPPVSYVFTFWAVRSSLHLSSKRHVGYVNRTRRHLYYRLGMFIGHGDRLMDRLDQDHSLSYLPMPALFAATLGLICKEPSKHRYRDQHELYRSMLRGDVLAASLFLDHMEDAGEPVALQRHFLAPVL